MHLNPAWQVTLAGRVEKREDQCCRECGYVVDVSYFARARARSRRPRPHTKSLELTAGFGLRLPNRFVDQILGVIQAHVRCVDRVFCFVQLVQSRVEAAVFHAGLTQ